MNTSTKTEANRVAIVTGGSRGIGRATVLRLAKAGYDLVVNFSGNAAEADAAVAEATAVGARAIAIQGDVADEIAVEHIFDEAAREFGGVDVVVHAAGRMLLAPMEALELAVLDSLFRTNVRGTFVVNQQAARRVRRGGAVVNFSTSVVGLYFPTYSAYASGKAAIETATRILARELRGRDITVNAVAPGPTATDLFLDGKDEETIERLSKQPPLERLGTPEDIAAVVAFLVGPDGRWVNGQVLRANGGII
jgi:3-oxoacyl-[acyl-carrier protein] reductase